jgi:hypothetical protein
MAKSKEPKQTPQKPLGTLASDIAARIVQKRPGFPTWFEKLPKDLQDALDDVRRRYESGDISSQQRPFALAIAAEVADRGFPEPGLQAVLIWLRKKR